MRACPLIAAVLFLSVVGVGHAAIATNTLSGVLTEGSLAGTTVNVTFSYDTSFVSPFGEVYLPLASFDFTLSGVKFTRNEIFQGGQVIFRNGEIFNVTASYQVSMPPGSPVRNITFGFGGPGVIGYIDNNGAFGRGTFTVGTGCIVQLSPPVAGVAAEGSNDLAVTVTTSTPGCTWTLAAADSWVAVRTLTGTGNATVPYTAYPNFSASSRFTTISAGGTTTTVGQAGMAGSADERFVRLLYFAFLGRLPSDAETAYQVTAGIQNVGRTGLTLNLFNSAEFNNGGRYIAGLYFGVLNRTPEFTGWLFQRNALATGLVDPISLVRNFVFSAEFQLAHGGITDSEFVRLLYRQILLREPTQAEVDFQITYGMAGGRVPLASSFLQSPEFQQKLGPQMTAFLLYSTLLGRDASAGELAWRAQQIQQGASFVQMISDFISSPEFSARIQ